MIDKDRAATGGVRAIDVLPAIADHPARGELDVEGRRGALKHARLGLAALTRLAMLRTRVKTNFKTIKDWDQFRQPLINGLNKIACLFSPPDVGLVGDDDKAESSLLEPLAARDGIRRKLQRFRRVRRIGLSISDNRLIKNAVSIQEDATVYRGDQRHAIKDRNSERSRNECGGPAVLRHSLGDAFYVTCSGATVRH